METGATVSVFTDFAVSGAFAGLGTGTGSEISTNSSAFEVAEEAEAGIVGDVFPAASGLVFVIFGDAVQY